MFNLGSYYPQIILYITNTVEGTMVIFLLSSNTMYYKGLRVWKN